MVHHKYKTDGIVLGGINVGESNRFLYIFTRELGLVGASAQGVRELKSKLRYSLQNFSYSNIELVRGKQVWRITNAENIYTLSCFVDNEKKQKVYINIITFIKRFFTGEEANGALFDDVISGFLFFKSEELSPEELKSFETIMMLKILRHLGYFGDDLKFVLFFKKANWGREILMKISTIRIDAISEINKAIDHSHL